MFSHKRSTTKIKALSGGECNRVILAKLLTKPINLLVLDEPTNDLDVETLEVLEDRLNEYEGTLIIVSHDREFIDNTVTSTLVFEDEGKVRAYPGGYSDWLQQGQHLRETDDPNKTNAEKATPSANAGNPKPATKLSYKLKLELEQLPDRIMALENAIAQLQSMIQKSDFYSQSHDRYQPVLDELALKEQELQQTIDRWGELESIQNTLSSNKS